MDNFGSKLTVHHAQGDQAVPTRDVMQSKRGAVFGVYFSADWCKPCAEFTPVLVAFAKTRATNFTIILVSGCQMAEDTKQYFAKMPGSHWAAMEHKEAMGVRGAALKQKYKVTTIPALVLLDSKGNVICAEGREKLRVNPQGQGFPWAPSARGQANGQFGGSGSIRPPGERPTFELPTNVPSSKPRAGRKSGEETVRSDKEKSQAVTWQMDHQVHARARNRTAAERGQPSGSRDVRRGANGRPQLTNRPFGDEAAPRPPTSTTKGEPRTNKRKSEPPKKVEEARPPPKPNLPKKGIKGKPKSLMQPQPLAGVHPFTPTLKKWQHGINVDCGPDWSWDVIQAAVARGPHPTALTPDALEVFKEDIDYQVRAGFSKVVTWEKLKRLRPKNLKISPVACIPQVGRRGRIILDLSFPVFQEVDGVVTATQASVNDTTALQAPSVPVKQIGKVLPNILQYMRDTPAGLHILFSKLDLSDGFWRLIVHGTDCYNFAYVLPQAAGEPTRIVVPSAVQMGWVESPSLFCTVTESARDLAQHFVDNKVELPYDPVEESMKIQAVPPRGRTDGPTKLMQVYVDDFCNAATQSKDETHIPTIRRASIHGIYALFPPPAVTKHEGGKDSISAKKLAQGDGNFDSTKDLIGFRFDGIKRTVRLPPEKAAAYIRETHRILRRKTVPLKTLQGVVGKLRHASIILQAAKGFFTPINAAMRGNPKIIGLGKDSEVRAALEDLVSLIRILGSRPTHVRELVPDMPHYVGYHDAAAEGAGGVWFSLVDDMPPQVWREEFPGDIATDVISDDNPQGKITNSDLELAAEVFAVGIALERAPKTKHAPLGTLCDNTPTVSWIDKMASKSKSPTAGRLLRGLAIMLFANHAGRLTTIHVPGVDNIMADIASRPTKAQKLFCANAPMSDADFSLSFDTAFPLPNDQRWTLTNVPKWLRSNVFETLRGKRLELRRWTGPSAHATGERGRRISASTPAARGRKRRHTSSSRLLSPCGKASTASELRSKFSRSSELSGTSPKDSFWTDIKTHDNHPQPSNLSTSPLLNF